MSSPVGCKSTRARFTYNDDLAFLKEFMAHNPLQNINGWEEIQRNLELITRKKFSIRTLKHHLQLLIEIWLKKDEGDKIRSGVEEILSEKDTLLQEISSLCSEYIFTTKRKQPVSKEHQLSELGKKARDKFASIFVEKPDEIDNNEIPAELATPVYELQDHNYVNSDEIPISIIEDVEVVNEVGEITDINTKSSSGTAPTSKNKKELKISSNPNISKSGSNILGPARKRWNKREPIRKNALSYLSEKHERENELKKKELDLEDRKLNIEERRLDLAERKYELDKQRLEIECQERLQRLEVEKENVQIELHEKQITVHLLQSQQKLIDSILQKK